MWNLAWRRLVSPSPQDRAWSSAVEPIALGVAVGLGYFFAARLSLLLHIPTDGVAVFWPAAGIALGTLIAFGPRARLSVVTGVMAATVAANLLGDRNLASAVVFAIANAGEALFAAWLIRRRFGPDFSFDSVRRVLSFVAVVAVACAVSGAGATAGVVMFHNPGASALNIWLNWSLSDALGAIAVAPLIVGVVRTIHNLPEPAEFLEGTLALVALAVVSIVTLSTSSHIWFTISPLGLILPLLLWLAARMRPLFAAIGVFAVALVIVWTTTFGIGRLGDASVPDLDRVHAARAALLIVSMFGLILAALFAERRAIEAALAVSNERLRLAVDGAQLGIWSLDFVSDRFENNVRDREIHRQNLEAPPVTGAEARSYIHPDDLAMLDDRFQTARRTYGDCKTEYRVAPITNSTPERWVALEGTVFCDADGRRLGLIGVTRDITERKKRDEALEESERTLRELLEAIPASIYLTDAAGYVTYCNRAAVELWGTRPKFGEDKWCDLARFYHRDGTPMPIECCPTELALKQGRSMRTLEAILERRDGTCVPILPCPSPLFDASGVIVGAVNMTIDVSELRAAELALAERSMQLDLAGKVALVGTFAFDVTTDCMTISPGYAAIHGLPEGSDECTRANWRSRVHPDDLPHLERRLAQTLVARQRNHYCDYRIVRPDGEVRWIESRSYVSYDGDKPRLTGANIDVTNRKAVEQALGERKMQLSLAERAAGVGSYSVEVGSDLLQMTEGFAALHGLPEGTTEVPVSELLNRMPLEDLEKLDNVKRQSYREHREEYGIEYRIVRPGGEVRWIESRSFISYNDRNQPHRVIGLHIDVTERRRAEEHQRLLLAELDHRVKNVLATVVAVAASTLDGSSSMQHFVAALDARIRALASTHELLSTRQWQGLPLYDLLTRQLKPYAAHRNTHLNGPDVLLMAEAGQAISMVLHELATNAAKHGALSTSIGCVSVQWHLSKCASSGDSLTIDWQETDGPIVKAPGKAGYGMSVITDLLAYELGGRVDFTFSRGGVRCLLAIPAKWMISVDQLSPDLNGTHSARARAPEARISELHTQHS